MTPFLTDYVGVPVVVEVRPEIGGWRGRGKVVKLRSVWSGKS